MAKKDDSFENYKRDLRRVLAADPMKTCEETVGLFLKMKILTTEQLMDQEFKLLQVQLMKRISGYRYKNGENGFDLMLRAQSLEYHQMKALESIDPKYQEKVNGSDILDILGQLNEHQTKILRVMGVPDGTDILAYMSALREMKKHQIEVLRTLGFPKEMGAVEYFTILKDFDEYKTTILKKLPKKLPGEITLSVIIRALNGMKVIEKDGTTELNFEKWVNSSIIDVITGCVYKQVGINPETRLTFVAVDADGKQIDVPEECGLKILSQRCKHVLSEYPNCYIIISDSLDAKTLQNNGFDFSCMNHIVIDGDFTCSKNNRVFPFMIKGTFNCQNLGKEYITQDTILPYARTINCAYSIIDFGVLIEILNKDAMGKGVRTLIVEPKLIRRDSPHLAAAKELVAKYKEKYGNTKDYQDLNIIDIKGNTLSDALSDKVEKVNDKKTEKSKEEKPDIVKQVLEQKVPGKHMGVKDIMKYCRKERKNDFVALTDDALKRLIQRVLSDQRKNFITKKMMQLADGTPVVCIDASQINLVCQEILKIMQEDAARDELKSKTADNPIKIKQEKKPKSVKKQNAEQPINITKYISYDLYKTIETSSQHKIDDVLCDINEINLDPIDPKMQDQNRIPIIKNGVRTVSTNIKRDGGACLVQSVDSSIKTDKKRIVWAVANGPDGELIIVGIGFCDDHSPNKRNKKQGYDYLRQLAFKKRTYTKEELSRYMKVEDLLQCNTTNDVLMQATMENMEHKH